MGLSLIFLWCPNICRWNAAVIHSHQSWPVWRRHGLFPFSWGRTTALFKGLVFNQLCQLLKCSSHSIFSKSESPSPQRAGKAPATPPQLSECLPGWTQPRRAGAASVRAAHLAPPLTRKEEAAREAGDNVWGLPVIGLFLSSSG